MTIELETLAIKKQAWEVVDREPWMNVLPSTWAFKCKRYPDGLVKKLKARFCVRGDRQREGVDFFETFRTGSELDDSTFDANPVLGTRLSYSASRLYRSVLTC
jgi:hypothetical protein